MIEQLLFCGEGLFIDDWDYVGLVEQSEFITYPDLYTTAGMTIGTAINPTAGWLKFKKGDKLTWIPQKPIRTSFAWTALNNLGLVNGKNIVIGERTYNIRLMTGINVGAAYYPTCEWNMFMYSIAESRASNYPGRRQANLTDEELGISETANPQGRSNYCIEIEPTNNLNIVRRAYSGGVTERGVSSRSTANLNSGWRPILMEV